MWSTCCPLQGAIFTAGLSSVLVRRIVASHRETPTARYTCQSLRHRVGALQGEDFTHLVIRLIISLWNVSTIQEDLENTYLWYTHIFKMSVDNEHYMSELLLVKLLPKFRLLGGHIWNLERKKKEMLKSYCIFKLFDPLSVVSMAREHEFIWWKWCYLCFRSVKGKVFHRKSELALVCENSFGPGPLGGVGAPLNS